MPKRLLVGRPLHTSKMGDTLLPKKLALPVFCSDPLSSNAYATEEILLMLSLGGLSLLHLTPWVAGAVVLLLIVVVLSYRQTCQAYAPLARAKGMRLPPTMTAARGPAELPDMLPPKLNNACRRH